MRAQLDALEAAARPAPQQQRKQATILFADIVGFTALSERRDAEEVTELINDLWERIDGVVATFGGRIDKHIGDAVMALWGSETTREDDPEQAVRAALAIQAEVELFGEAARVAVACRRASTCKFAWASTPARCCWARWA